MAYVRTIVAVVTFLGILGPWALVWAQECAGFDTTSRTGEIVNDAIDEASGLSASWRHKGLLWTHNDSGDGSRLFLMKPDGSHVATVTLEGVPKAKDWEDLAVGPCAPVVKHGDGEERKEKPERETSKSESTNGSCVFVADIGDNRAKRNEVVVYRFEEPDLPDKLPADVAVKADEQIWFRYPGGARDAETLMVHPSTGVIYVVDKRIRGRSGVYRIPRRAGSQAKQASDAKQAPEASQSSSKKKPLLAKEVGQLRIDAQGGFASMITAGDISPNGREFTVRTYLSVYTFCADGDDFESAVDADPVQSSPPFMIQSEALGYDRGGGAIWVTSERRPSPLHRMERTQD